MKKFLLMLTLLIPSTWLISQDCSDLFISEYVEGWSNNKALEIYNPTAAAITLDGTYRLIRWSNGDALADEDFRYVLPLEGTIDPYQVIVMIQDTNFPGQDTMIYPGLRAKANYLAPPDYNAGSQGCRVVFWNGDDAVSLQKNNSGTWTDIDIFGEIGVRPTLAGNPGQLCGWDDTPPYADGIGNYLTLNQTLYRKHNIKYGITRDVMNGYGPNSFYALDQYDSLPANTFDSLGFHRCDCEKLAVPDNIKPLRSSIYPNPVTERKFLILSDFEMSHLEIYGLDGALVAQTHLNGRQFAYTIPPGIGKGIYLVRVYDRQEHSSSTKLILF